VFPVGANQVERPGWDRRPNVGIRSFSAETGQSADGPKTVRKKAERHIERYQLVLLSRNVRPCFSSPASWIWARLSYARLDRQQDYRTQLDHLRKQALPKAFSENRSSFDGNRAQLAECLPCQKKATRLS
jgi:hypothetical protein